MCGWARIGLRPTPEDCPRDVLDSIEHGTLAHAFVQASASLKSNMMPGPNCPHPSAGLDLELPMAYGKSMASAAEV